MASGPGTAFTDRFSAGRFKKNRGACPCRGIATPQAGQSESQDICFINDNDYRQFLEEYFPERVKRIGQGTFIDKENTVIGHHGGYHRFTTGQRKGLRIAMGKPVYVRKIDPENNSVLITDAADMEDASCRITATNWIAMEKPVRSISASVKVRYRNKGVSCRIEPIDGSDYRVDFLGTQKAVTPGQSAVFYDNDRVLGGGIIVGPEYGGATE
ncbi:MAG: aminomethyltransferase beta-barrel domain-containing protein [Candidatus Marinimicrobia bacterium]|nr:aminomethyltransferase beta-barrel domain-containing protein [Candidatus Neomarinimicrobiota bacterium]